jgi:hypothetical protein
MEVVRSKKNSICRDKDHPLKNKCFVTQTKKTPELLSPLTQWPHRPSESQIGAVHNRTVTKV